jgi:hypothetical protein
VKGESGGVAGRFGGSNLWCGYAKGSEYEHSKTLDACHVICVLGAPQLADLRGVKSEGGGLTSELHSKSEVKHGIWSLTFRRQVVTTTPESMI